MPDAPCIYCDTEPHTDGCPQATNVYVMTPTEWPHGLRCMVCGDLICEGETYSHLDTESEDIYWIACVGCAVLDGIKGATDAG